jgi:hypothetical protein
MAPRPDDPPLSAITKYSKGYQVKIESKDDPEVVQSRLRREEADAEHQRHKEVLILWAILITVGVVSVFCLWIVLIPGYPTENVKWATTLLTMIVSGGLGYTTGKNSKSAT